MRGRNTTTVGLVLLTLSACAGGDQPPAREAAPATPAAAPSGARAPTILVIGTSLTAGFGVDPAVAWPAVLQRKIDSAGLPFHVVNAGVSGETSAGALRRADWLLAREHPAVVVLETGGNDGLRGLDPDTLRANIAGVLAKARAQSPAPALVLMAMEAPPNLGDAYTRRFRQVFPDAAAAAGAELVPFFLNGVAGVDSLNQGDGIHPNVAGHDIAGENAFRALLPLLRRLANGGG